MHSIFIFLNQLFHYLTNFQFNTFSTNFIIFIVVSYMIIDETVWKNIPKYKRLTTGDNVYLVVAEHVLAQNRTYKIEHRVSNLQNGTIVSKHIFTTNRLPHSGTCTPDKYELKAADSVTITCKDWIDADPFLRYEAWTHSPFSNPKLLYFGNASTFALKLPLGESSKNFTLRLEVKVFDFFESTDVFINLTVSDLFLAKNKC